MIRRLSALLLVLMATPAAATAQDRSWSRHTFAPEVYWAHDLASTAPGEAVFVHRTVDGTFATVHGLSGPGEAQTLDGGWTFHPAVDASAAGGAVAAWLREGAGANEIHVAERPAGDGPFAASVSTISGPGDYGYSAPRVAVNERGDAIVLYLGYADAPGTLALQVKAIYRPAGGEFGAPEGIGLPATKGYAIPRSVALAPDGTAVVGFVRGGVPQVARRPPGGPFEAAQRVGVRAQEHAWHSPEVGIDAAGNVVAAWVEDSGEEAGDVRIRFRRAGETAFGEAGDTGLQATVVDQVALRVSAIGEALLLVEASTNNPTGGTHREGLHVVPANAATARAGRARAITGFRGSYPSFAMNRRGDAMVVYDECCPMAIRALRRPPLGPFGAVEDLQPPIHFKDSRGGIAARTADIDAFGNARATYEDFELDRTYLATGLPTVTEEPPEPPPLGDRIPPVLSGEPDDEPEPEPEPQPDPDVKPDVEPEPAAEPAAELRPDESAHPPARPPVTATAPTPHPPVRALPPAGAPSVDRVAPGLRVAVRRRVAGRARRRVVTTIRCSEACSVVLAGTFAGRPLRPLQVGLASVRVRRVGLRLPAGTRRRGVVRITATAVDAAGNVARRPLTARLR